VLAALGGSVLFFGFHLQERPLPIPLVIGHGLICGDRLRSFAGQHLWGRLTIPR
jgi:hypothetical protein